ncbi:MAG: signal peptidase II, partial [Chloroflexi bacterium]|nr:signal peptidase II [Chloroflexota bacterium]
MAETTTNHNQGRTRRPVWPYLIILLAFILDRLSKWWAAEALAGNHTITLGPFLTLQETYNAGIAFGLLPGIGPAVGWLSVGVIVGLFIYQARLPRPMSAG